MQKIKALRLAAGLTQEELARKMELSRPSIANWEAGVALPRTKDLRKLAECLKCKVDDLV